MNLIFDSIIFRWETKSVPAHRVEHVIALHSPLSSHDVKSCIRPWMAYMKSLSAWIWKLHQRVVLGLCVVRGRRKCLLIHPNLLPLRLDDFRIVCRAHNCPPGYVVYGNLLPKYTFKYDLGVHTVVWSLFCNVNVMRMAFL